MDGWMDGPLTGISKRGCLINSNTVIKNICKHSKYFVYLFRSYACYSRMVINDYACYV